MLAKKVHGTVSSIVKQLQQQTTKAAAEQTHSFKNSLIKLASLNQRQKKCPSWCKRLCGIKPVTLYRQAGRDPTTAPQRWWEKLWMKEILVFVLLSDGRSIKYISQSLRVVLAAFSNSPPPSLKNRLWLWTPLRRCSSRVSRTIVLSLKSKLHCVITAPENCWVWLFRCPLWAGNEINSVICQTLWS